MMKWMILLLIASSALGAGVLSINLSAGLALFPYRIILVLVIGMFLLTILSNRWGLNLSHIRVRTYLQFLLIWILYAGISFLWAKDKGSVVKDVVYLLTNISMVILVIYFFRSLRDYEYLYDLWLIILIPLLGLGLWNHITGQQLTEYAFNIPNYAREEYMHAPRATFTNPNDYATYLSLSIPFVITFIRYTKRNTLRMAGALLFLGCLYVMLYTHSRANYIATLFGIIFWYFYLVRNPTSKMKVIIMLTAFVLLLFTFSGTMVKKVDDIFMSQMTSLTESTDDGSINTRSNLIKNSLRFLSDSLGLGIGAGNSEYYMENYGVYDTRGITNIHNWWIELLVEYGILFFLAYLIFYFNILLKLIRMYKALDTAAEKKICESLLTGLAVFFFASISSSSILNFMPQWILFAFCLGFLNYHRIRNAFKVNYEWKY